MVKITGCLVVILGTTLMGFKAADKIKQRYKSLMYLKKILIMLRAEIDYNQSEINEIFGELQKRTVGAFSKFFGDLYDETKGFYNQTISVYWDKAVDTKLCDIEFQNEDLQKIKELGENIGYLDKKMQLNNIDYTLDYIDRETNDLSLNMDKNMKMWKMFGALAGVFVTIVFV